MTFYRYTCTTWAVYTLYSTAWRTIHCTAWHCAHHRAWQCNHLCSLAVPTLYTVWYSMGAYTIYSFALYTLYSSSVNRQYSLAVRTLYQPSYSSSSHWTMNRPRGQKAGSQNRVEAQLTIEHSTNITFLVTLALFHYSSFKHVFCDTIKTVHNIKRGGNCRERSVHVCALRRAGSNCRLLRVPFHLFPGKLVLRMRTAYRGVTQGGGGVIYHSGTIFTMGGICVILNG